MSSNTSVAKVHVDSSDPSSSSSSSTAIIPVDDESLIPAMRKKKKCKVLDEDTYLENIEKIVERDFFPDLPKLKAQLAYHDAQEKSDHQEMARIKAQFTSFCRPETGISEAGFRTPKPKDDNSTGASGSNLNKASDDTSGKRKNPSDLNLDKYLTKYTSEDNESFDDIQDEMKRRHMAKNPWMYQDEGKLAIEHEEMLKLPDIERQAVDGEKKTQSLLTWPYKNKNLFMYNPDPVNLSFDETLSQVTKKSIVVHQSTRFTRGQLPYGDPHSSQQAIADAALLHAKENEGKVGPDGKALATVGPMVNGYPLVSLTPSPAPDAIPSTPLMTWGEIEGTPFRLDATPSRELLPEGTPQFKVPDVPPRDLLGISLADKVSKQYRARKQRAISHMASNIKTSDSTFGAMSPKTSPGLQLSRMSPAAQRLATMKLGITRAADPKLQASYSPANNRHPFTPSPSRSSSSVNTPSSSLQSLRSSSSKGSLTPKTPVLNTISSITDNLLKLPKK